MTTIAFDGKTMAADRQSTSSYTKLTREPKLFRVNGSVFGVCGKSVDKIAFREWLKGNRERPDVDGESFVALEASAEGFFRWDDCTAGFRYGFPAAIGSGVDFAMGAMLAGANSRRAVLISSRLDESSGFGIQTMKAPS